MNEVLEVIAEPRVWVAIVKTRYLGNVRWVLADIQDYPDAETALIAAKLEIEQ